MGITRMSGALEETAQRGAAGDDICGKMRSDSWGQAAALSVGDAWRGATGEEVSNVWEGGEEKAFIVAVRLEEEVNL